MELTSLYEIHASLSAAISSAPAENKQSFQEQLEDIHSTFWDYLAHILRTKHQGDYYR